MELLLVVAIIGILGAVGLPVYQGYLDKAKKTDAILALRSISAAQERYKMVSGTYFTNTITGPSAASSAEISQSLLNGTALNTSSYYYYIPPLASCAAPPTRTPTRPARLHCAVAQSVTNSSNTYTIDQTDYINDQNNNDVQ